jgi:hypothetical protein
MWPTRVRKMRAYFIILARAQVRQISRTRFVDLGFELVARSPIARQLLIVPHVKPAKRCGA